MTNKKNLDQLDLKIVFALTNSYETLYKQGKITEKQFKKTMEVLENFQDYELEELKSKLEVIYD